MKHPKIALIGNPNCGKSTLFNALTGIHQETGNWPGVTVERKQGAVTVGQRQFELIDLPGIYSIEFQKPTLDERVAKEYLLSGDADYILNVVDASLLERHLNLTYQLLEMGLPVIVVLNMSDVASQQGLHIDKQALSKALGCPVVDTIASQNKGMAALKQLLQQLQQPVASDAEQRMQQTFTPAIQQAIQQVQQLSGIEAPWDALQALQFPELLPQHQGEIKQIQSTVACPEGVELDLLVADQRYAAIHQQLQQVVARRATLRDTLTDKLDSLVLNKWLGLPIFFAIIYFMFWFTISIGGSFIDLFDIAVGAFFVDGLSHLLTQWGAPEWLKVFLADGVGGGIQTVATFVPIIAFLYLFLSFLEASGYMARAALVMDRGMRALGLSGKAFVPLILGFGCNVPSVMASRTLERYEERIMTILMSPFMSCGARLSVYALFAAAFFGSNGTMVVFALYLVGILVAILTAFILKWTLVKVDAEPLLMELPAYHLPTLRGILQRTWHNLRNFVIDAGKIIVIMVAIINVMNNIGTDGSFGHQDSEGSVLSQVSQSITPLFKPIGIEEDNWPATVGIFTGVLAKEVVVGTLDAIYNSIDEADNSAEETADAFSLSATLLDALATVPANLKDALLNVDDPLGLSILDSVDSGAEAAAESQEVSVSTFTAMQQRFDGAIGAFAYLLFILLYFPCTAVVAAIARESSRGWALFAVLWGTGIAYGLATLFYQLATIAQHPVSSLLWSGGVIAAFMMTVVMLVQYAQRLKAKQIPVAVRYPC